MFKDQNVFFYSFSCISGCLRIAIFLQYYDFMFLSEIALQDISMFFRSEPKWELIESLPDLG